MSQVKSSSKGSLPDAQGLSPWAFQPMLHQEFNVLKARLLNLAESTARDDQQATALKGLIKDFVNDAYYGSCRSIEKYARQFKVLESGDGIEFYTPLQAESLKDVHLA